MRVIGVLVAVLAASHAVAQDRARPREGSERERPPERVQPAPPPQAAPAPPPRQEQSEAEERHARPRRERDDPEVPFGLAPEQRRPRPAQEGEARQGRPDRERPEPPRREYGPRGDDGLTDAERRHPRPDPNRNWRERRHNWRDYPDYPWWYGRNDWYWFPYSYDFGWYTDDLYLDGYLLRPHGRYWSEHGVSFYWPFDAPPRFGCHWYWVPTGRDVDRHGIWRNRRYRYYGWRLVYLCVDGRPYPW